MIISKTFFLVYFISILKLTNLKEVHTISIQQNKSFQFKIIQKSKKQNIKKFSINDDSEIGNFYLFEDKLYKISSLRQAGIYLTFIEPNLLTSKQWINDQSQLFYFSHVGSNKYQIISAYSQKSLKTQKSFDKNVFRFDKVLDNNLILSKQKFKSQSKTTNQQNQYNQYKSHIWQLSRDYDEQSAFLIKNLNGHQLSNQLVRYKDKEPIYTQSIYQQKDKIWIIKEYQQDPLQSLEQYDQQIGQIYRDLTKVRQTKIYSQKWLDYFQLKYTLSINYPGYPKWLQKYDISTLPIDIPIKQKQNGLLEKIYNIGNAFKSKVSSYCTEDEVISYIWLGNKQMPPEYVKTLKKCGKNAQVLGQAQLQKYTRMWNQQTTNNSLKIKLGKQVIRQKINKLKLLYLYFQGGIYSDFDSQINQQCFNGIITDQILFTSNIPFESRLHIIPEESFMRVNKKFNPQIKRMLQSQISGGDRWYQCRQRQCLIVNCQRHLYDRTYFNGYF